MFNEKNNKSWSLCNFSNSPADILILPSEVGNNYKQKKTKPTYFTCIIYSIVNISEGSLA